MISSVEFFRNFNAIAETLDELEELLEYLQSRNITLVVDKAIRTIINWSI